MQIEQLHATIKAIRDLHATRLRIADRHSDLRDEIALLQEEDTDLENRIRELWGLLHDHVLNDTDMVYNKLAGTFNRSDLR